MDSAEAELKQRIVNLLDWALPVFRPGTSAHGEFADMAARLRDPEVRLRPLAGFEDVEVRRLLASLSLRSAELVELAGRLPERAGIDADRAAALAVGAKAMQEELRGTVTYGQIVSLVQGNWGDSDLGQTASDLVRDLEYLARATDSELGMAPG